MNVWQLLQDPNTQWVLAGCILLGVSSGVLGCFAFLRGRSLMGDALAHAALPGVCLAYIVSGSKSIGLFLIGAAIAGLIASYCIAMITKHSRIKEDSALAIVLSVFFGFGIVLLTYIQHSNQGNQSGLDKFLFGQAASLVGDDVVAMIVVSATLLLLTTLLFKEFKLLVFDSGFGRGLGYPMELLDGLLMLLLLVSVVIGLQAVGVVLVAAMLIAPAVTARYWTEKLGIMVVLSGCFGALSGVLGTLFSTQAENLPTGPVIVLAATCFFLFSLVFSPSRGILFRFISFLKLRQKVLQDDVLQALYERMESDHAQMPYQLRRGYTVESLAAKSGKRAASVQQALSALHRLGLVEPAASSPTADSWTFTSAGLKAAYELVLNRRLWDVYLMNEHHYQSLSIDLNQEALTTQLSPSDLEEMLHHLESYNLTPKLTENNMYAGQLQTSKQGGIS
ncbi:metal ABC transporter permease [Brevibacillus humidisoli]|uniref:metal ABC transporter permease n=1 Tax=Brevibacillus humidisoli TaxID=2895522 RepID=UPI001E298978|nr:metal ABC transporter permease [Brevibacillus humidisoli]UFJ43087.1 metal ABC transporter permease [Brevibacillus humidisoli]